MNLGTGADAFENRHDPRVPKSVLEASQLLTEADYEGVDGVVVNAVIEPWPFNAAQKVAWGYLFGDKKCRFYEGQWIHTSEIVSGPDEDGILKTKFSTYRLKMKPESETDDASGPAQA